MSTTRRLTIEHGLSGFTVDQVCQAVDVSRRTFFNYFPSKEDAVLGHSEDGLPEEVLADFAASGRAVPRRPLLDALAALLADLGNRVADSREDYEAMSAVLRREPQLMARLVDHAESKARLLTELIRSREGLPVDHPAPRVAVVVLGGLARQSLDEFFAADNDLAYAQIYHRNVDALHYLFDGSGSQYAPSQNQDSA